VKEGRSEEKLIEELLHNAQASGNRALERRLADLTIWFYKNKGSIPRDNLAARQAFLEKGFWIQMEVIALLLERNHELEAAKRGMSNLWLPRGLDYEGDLRKFG
jgi:hypothetical protein